MIAEIMRTKCGMGNRGDAGDIIGYIFGMTKHDHAAEKVSFLCSHNIDLPDPALVIGPDGSLTKINGAEADITPFVEDMERMVQNNPDVTYPFKHMMISLAPGEKLGQDQWEDVAREFMKRMGYEHCKWVAVRHSDTSKDHIHLAAITIQDLEDYPVVDQWYDYPKAMEILRDFEKRSNLTEVPNPEDAENINHPERQVVKTELRKVIDYVIDQCIQGGEKGLPGFVSSLAYYGVGVKFQMQNGKPKGISYSFKGSSFAGKRLGGGGRYTLPKIQKAGIEYDKARDKDLIELYNAEEQARRDGGAPQLRVRRLPPKAEPEQPQHEFTPEEKIALLGPAGPSMGSSGPCRKPPMESTHERVSFGDNMFYMAVRIPKIQLRRSKYINRAPNKVRTNGNQAMLFYMCRNKGEAATAKMIQAGMQLFAQITDMFEEIGFDADEVQIMQVLEAYEKGWKEMRRYTHDYSVGLTQSEPEALEQELREILIGYDGGSGTGGIGNKPLYAA